MPTVQHGTIAGVAGEEKGSRYGMTYRDDPVTGICLEIDLVMKAAQNIDPGAWMAPVTDQDARSRRRVAKDTAWREFRGVMDGR